MKDNSLDGITNIKFADDAMIEKPDGTVHFESTSIEFDYEGNHYKIPHTIGTPVDIVRLHILEAITF